MSDRREPFHKVIGSDFDKIEVSSAIGSDWLAITQHVGNNVERVTITLRSDEAVHDLHYALTRYLATLPA